MCSSLSPVCREDGLLYVSHIVRDLQEKTEHQDLLGSLVHLDGLDFLVDKVSLEANKCQLRQSVDSKK